MMVVGVVVKVVEVVVMAAISAHGCVLLTQFRKRARTAEFRR